jgi:transcriptional regulator with XRE-family HTH domain
MTLTPAQVKEARKLLGWSQMRLAVRAGVAYVRLTKYETGRLALGAEAHAAIHAALETEGIKFGGGLSVKPGIITPAQCRAARGLLYWTQSDLAEKAGVSAVTLRNFEHEKSGSHAASIAAIQRVLEAAGVEFEDKGHGVRLSKGKP